MLDEPINGLDPQGISAVRDIILQLNRDRGITIFISSHILSELEKIATVYGMIHKGKLIKELTDEQLNNECAEKIELVLKEPEKACVILDKMGFTQYKVVGQHTIHIFDHLEESGRIASELVHNNVCLDTIDIKKTSLEDYFLKLTEEGSIC